MIVIWKVSSAMDEILRWLIGDIGLPIIICIVSIVVGFFSGRTYERKITQRNSANIKGNKNNINQCNTLSEHGDKNGKQSGKN